jgi:hypothetical protein
LVGWQAAFASKLAPTVDWGGLLEIGRLGGRYREQAHSYRKAKADRRLFTTQMAECQLAESS